MARARLHIRGSIQGVGFRHHLRRLADSLGLRGRADNQPDGTVEVIAEGESTALEAFIQRCRRGTAFARVDEVNVTWEEDRAEYRSFVTS